MLQDEFWDDDDDFISWLRPYTVQDGVLTIPVRMGVLLNKMSIEVLGIDGRATPTPSRSAFERGIRKTQRSTTIAVLILAIDSPGGAR